MTNCPRCGNEYDAQFANSPSRCDDCTDELSTWRTPYGDPLRGTLERIPGIALVDENEARDDDGDPNHAGDTDVIWDGQETVIRAGQRVWVDESGNEFLESELLKPGQEIPEPSTAVHPLSQYDNIRLLLGEHVEEAGKLVFRNTGKSIKAPVDLAVAAAIDIIAKALHDALKD